GGGASVGGGRGGVPLVGESDVARVVGEFERRRGGEEQLGNRRSADRMGLVTAELQVLDRCPPQPAGPGGRVAGKSVVDAPHSALELELVEGRERLHRGKDRNQRFGVELAGPIAS